MSPAPSAVQVDVDGGALTLATPPLADALARLREATEALGALFATLAAEPARYESLREDLGRLTRERRTALERIGQLSAEVFVVRNVEAQPASSRARAEVPRADADVPPDSRILLASHAVVMEEDPVATVRLPSDWPFFKWTRGKTMVMLGGEVREERRLALEEAFECSTLTWVPHDRPRLLQALVERASQGRIDVILVNKLVGLNETTALARASAAPVIMVRLGYDVVDVKTALEEHFGKR